MTGPAEKSPHIIVIGNEKGGTGKSTLSMHLTVNFLREKAKVGTIDLDARQGSLSRYIENRNTYATANPKHNIPLPHHYALFKSEAALRSEAEKEESEKLLSTFDALKTMDYIIIDTPGTDSFLSRLAHSYADTLVTPMNDSLVDLDMLGRVEENSIRPSKYAEMVWDQKKHRLMRGDRRPIDWIVVRNRLSSLNARNKEEVERLLLLLAKKIGLRAEIGFGERVIFRELFLQGLTLLDLREIGAPASVSHVAARQEIKALAEAILRGTQQK